MEIDENCNTLHYEQERSLEKNLRAKKRSLKLKVAMRSIMCKLQGTYKFELGRDLKSIPPQMQSQSPQLSKIKVP